MNLLEIRTEVVKRSGRYDLVTDTSAYADNGANNYIYEGQRWLDRKAQVDKQTATKFTQVSTGARGVIIQDCRVIEEVWIGNSTKRTWLDKINPEVLRGEDGYETPTSGITQGRPLYYAPARLRLTPPPDTLAIQELDSILDYSNVMFGSHHSYNGVIWYPPTDGTYIAEVIGKFYSRKLTSDTDENNWSVMYQDVLIMAALRQLEIFNRNTEGVNDWTNAINDALTDIEFDLIDEESTQVKRMEG